MSMYQEAKERYAAWGVDADSAIARLKEIPVSIHCWQGDDVTGLENAGEALSGGIQATGNYPGKARTFEELTADFNKACSLIPGKKRLNLHASYAVMTEENRAERDELRPEHFKAWVDYAKQRGLGLDFNPTFFSHPMVKDGMTLSSPDETVRQFWIRHGIACRRIAAYFAKELNTHCLCNVWIPDGLKDVPADRLSPRLRLKDSLDQIFAEKLPGVIDSVESKVFGIGLEAYTVGSAEFCTNYVNTRHITPLMDNGHYHPTELVSDKISSMLLFNDRLALHITRPMRWDSDHVVLFDDETREMMKEVVRADALDRVFLATDYFDASINRISAWVTGLHSVQKALLYALLEPKSLKKLQDMNNFTELMVRQEELKTMPFGAVWEEYLRRENILQDYFSEIKRYEADVLSKR